MNDLNFYETDSQTGLNYIKEALKSEAPVPLNVTGLSMMPLLKQRRDTVWLVSCDVDKIKKGDILLFERNNGKPVLHRVRKIENDLLIMNGDALSYSETIEKRQVVAYVKKIVRKGKTIDTGSKKLKAWNKLWNLTLHIRPILRRMKLI